MHRCRLEPQSGMKQPKPCKLHFVSSLKHKFLFKSGPYDFASEYKSGTKQLRKSERTSPPHCTGHSCLSPQSQSWHPPTVQATPVCHHKVRVDTTPLYRPLLSVTTKSELTPPHCTGHSCLSPQSQSWHHPTVQATPVCHHKVRVDTTPLYRPLLSVTTKSELTPPHCTGHSCLSPQSQYWGKRGWQLTPLLSVTTKSVLREDRMTVDTTPLYRPLLSVTTKSVLREDRMTVDTTPLYRPLLSVTTKSVLREDRMTVDTTPLYRPLLSVTTKSVLREDRMTVDTTPLYRPLLSVTTKSVLREERMTVDTTPLYRPLLSVTTKYWGERGWHLPTVTTKSVLRGERMTPPHCTGHSSLSPWGHYWEVRGWPPPNHT